MVRPDRREILVVIGFAIALGVLTLATPIAVQSLVNTIAFGGLIQPLVILGILLFAFLVFAGVIRLFKFYVVEVLQRRLLVRTIAELSDRLPKVRIDAYDRGYGPELMNRFFDVMTINKTGSGLLIDGLDIVLQAGIGLLVLGFYHPYLLIFDLILIAVILFILLGLGRGAVRTATKESSAKYALADALEEIARAPATYKLAGAAPFARERLSRLTDTFIHARRDHYRIVFRQLLGATALHAVAGTALLVLGGFLVLEGELTLGQLVAAELIVSIALASFVKFGKQMEAYYDLLAGADKLSVLFELPVERDRREEHRADNGRAALALSGVHYRYPGSPNFCLEGFDLKVASGERVAVLGGRGTGKTTIADLVTGLREPHEGVVLLDEADLRDVGKTSLRAQLDLVQGLEIVHGTVVDNLRLGLEGIHSEQVRQALARFGILEELLALPDGLQTELSATGSPLSHRTCILVMMARSYLAAPRAIVIDSLLDELDPEDAQKVLDVLGASDVPWTLLVFTSRREIAEALDRTVVLAPQSPRNGQEVRS